jgi:hypothetical protein
MSNQNTIKGILEISEESKITLLTDQGKEIKISPKEGEEFEIKTLSDLSNKKRIKIEIDLIKVKKTGDAAFDAEEEKELIKISNFKKEDISSIEIDGTEVRGEVLNNFFERNKKISEIEKKFSVIASSEEKISKKKGDVVSLEEELKTLEINQTNELYNDVLKALSEKITNLKKGVEMIEERGEETPLGSTISALRGNKSAIATIVIALLLISLATYLIKKNKEEKEEEDSL